MDSYVARAIIGLHKVERGAVAFALGYLKGELARRGNLRAALQ